MRLDRPRVLARRLLANAIDELGFLGPAFDCDDCSILGLVNRMPKEVSDRIDRWKGGLTGFFVGLEMRSACGEGSAYGLRLSYLAQGLNELCAQSHDGYLEKGWLSCDGCKEACRLAALAATETAAEIE